MSAADQQVAEVKIAVEPDRGAVPGWRLQRRDAAHRAFC
jgi:hypothetical protein